MSEQNSMAINPVYAGLGGAAIGGAAGALIKPLQSVQSDYREVKNLLTMDKDKFEKIEKPADDATAEIKDNYKVIEDGRKKISEAGDAFETNTIKPAKEKYETALNNHFKDDNDFKVENFKHNDKTIKDLETAVTDAEGKVTAETIAEDTDVKAAQTALDEAKGKVDVKAETKALEEAKEAAKNAGVEEAKIAEAPGVKAAQKALDDKIAGDADVQAKTTALENAKKAAVEKNETVASAKKALEEAKTDRLTKMEDKLKAAAEKSDADEATKNLFNDVKKAKENMTKKFDASKEADELLRDTKYGTAAEKIKGLLPRAKWKAAAIYGAALAAAGVALAYIVGPKNETPSDVA